MHDDIPAGLPDNLFAPIKRDSTLVTRVTAQLENLIFDGKLLVGDQVPPERELSRVFGVSRTVTHEAMSRLAAQGLLEPQAGGGMVITSPSAAAVGRSMTLMLRAGSLQVDHSKVLEVRRLLEVEIAGRAAQRRTNTDLAHMAALLTEAAEAQHDPIRFPALDVDFHMALARATHNELYVLLMEAVSDVLVGFRRLSYQVSSMPTRSLHHHQAVYAQVTAGSAEGARDAMRNHLAEAEQTVREAQLASFGQADPVEALAST